MTVTVWFMDNGTRLEVREYEEEQELAVIVRAGELADQYKRPVGVYEVTHVLTEVPDSNLISCDKCGHRWSFFEQGVMCPKCGHANLPF